MTGRHAPAGALAFVALCVFGLASADEAVACVDFAPGVQGTRFVKGLWQYKKGQYGKAAALFREALTHRPIDIIYLNLAWSLMEQGACADAWEAYERVLDSPHICGSPTKEELEEELRFALNQYQRHCGSQLRVRCDGADKVRLSPWPPGTDSLREFVGAEPLEFEGCPADPVALWPGTWRMEVTRGAQTTTSPLWVEGGSTLDPALPPHGTLVVTCQESAELYLDGLPFRKCHERVEVPLPVGPYVLSTSPDDEGHGELSSRVVVREGVVTEVEIGGWPHAPTTFALTVPARLTLLNLSPSVTDGLLYLTDEPGTGELAAVGVGVRMRHDLWLLGGRAELAAGRFSTPVEGTTHPFTATTLSPGAHLEAGVAPLGDTVSLWVGGGIGAAFYVEGDRALAPGEPRYTVTGTALRWTVGGRLCAGEIACLSVLHGSDDGVTLESRADDSRRALHPSWWSVGVEVDVVGLP